MALSLNPFVHKLASNLQFGTKLKGFKSSAFNELMHTAMCLRTEAITLDIKVDPDGLIDFEVVGVFDFYIAPAATDAIEHLQIALCDTGNARCQFIITVTPEGRFWIHSEQALASDSDDWASIWCAERNF